MHFRSNFSGHIVAFFTVFVWGTTFISTKVLLRTFSPVEILFIRFLLGYLALWLVFPKKLTLASPKQEWYFAAAGLCGVTLYYLMENIALTMTLASNVGVIISIAPFFTAVCSCLFLGEKRPGARFFIGFLISMAGISLISFNGSSELSLNPAGDLLSIGAAIVWALYSTITKKISAWGHPTVLTTRRTFFYGIVFMIPSLFFMDFHVVPEDFMSAVNMGNLIFLSFCASAMCFVTWNMAVRILGTVKTSVYIYMTPVVTTVCSALILKEPVTASAAAGIALTLAGLFLSEDRKKDAD